MGVKYNKKPSVFRVVYKKYLKRVFDFVLSLLAILFLSPIMIVVAILVRVKLGSPILFRQKRPGLNEKLFVMYKFRSMTNERNRNGELLPDYIRLTKFGRFLRETSLDELPELINIIKGDMSIVGPRPLLEEYLKLYDEKQKRRHEVRPGLTGYAQVNGRNTLDWSQKFILDVEYIDNISLLNDLRIIFKTIQLVAMRDGVSSQTSVTMEPFEGNHK